MPASVLLSLRHTALTLDANLASGSVSLRDVARSAQAAWVKAGGSATPAPAPISLLDDARRTLAIQAYIDFSSLPPATTPDDADRLFDARAAIVTMYNAFRPKVLGELFQDELDFTTVAIARLEQSRRSPFDLTEVRQALLRSRVRSLSGTSFDLSDATHGVLRGKRLGEWDVALRGLVTMMYRYSDELGPEVYAHVLHDLLDQRGPHDPAVEKVLGVLPETENHLLMIETSRYLTNQLLRREALAAGRSADEFDNELNGMNSWMLAFLQRFLQNDFQEYNARPYQVYTDMALHNLYDFARDGRVRVAARMMLDYIAARFAVSSNGLRRAVPFRRRKEYKDFTQLFANGCDPQTLRFVMLSGLTQPPLSAHVPWGGRDIMQLAAVSSYRVPPMILDLAMNKAGQPYYQRFHHDAVEIYSSAAEYLITAGGFWMESVHGHDELNNYEDAGWSLPTTLMPTVDGLDYGELIRIKGDSDDHHRTNTGVAPGFACGVNVEVPLGELVESPVIHALDGGSRASLSFITEGSWSFIDPSRHGQSTRAYGIYVAVYRRPLETPAWSNYGFFEVAASAGMSLVDFKDRVLTLNGASDFQPATPNDYTTQAGHRIRFVPVPADNKYQWGILSIDGQSMDTDIARWPLAQGDIINSVGKTGLVTIDNPRWNARLVLDMSSAQSPSRVETKLR